MSPRTWLLLVALVPAFAGAQIPALLPDHVSTDLQRKLAPHSRAFKIAFVFPRAAKAEGRGQYSYEPISEENAENAEKYIALFIEEFSKYPIEFIQASKLRRVLFVQDLAVNKQRRAAVPDTREDDLLYDVTFVRNERYARHVVHHELYHMLEEDWNGSAYYKDPNWALLNEPGFEYGAGGAAFQNGNVWDFTHPRTGFINVYATAGLEEDKAEIWAVMFVPENWKRVEPMLVGDSILRAKVGYMREFARSKSTKMDEAFWLRLVERAVSSESRTPN